MVKRWPPYMNRVVLDEDPTLSVTDVDNLKSPGKGKGTILLCEYDDGYRLKLVCRTCLITLTEKFNEGYCECGFCGERVGLEELARLLQSIGDATTDLLNLLAEYLSPEE